jgi:hypothetical protein
MLACYLTWHLRRPSAISSSALTSPAQKETNEMVGISPVMSS